VPKPIPAKLTAEQKAALKAYARRNGWFGKRRLIADWLTGHDVDAPEGAILREIRNACGPSVLLRLRPSHLE
jgi:hypothetical protein